MFAYCLNNPVNCTDDSGMFALSALLAVGGAVVGGGVAGALIGGISYLVTSGINGTQLTSDGFWGAVGVGAVNGAIGGAAGAAGIALKVGLSLTAGAIAGSYTASNATGTTGQKTWMGIATGIIAAGSTFVGASIDTSNLTPALTAFANYGTTMAVATPAEVVAVFTQQAISSVNTSPAVSTSTRPSPRASRNNYVECMLY